MCFCFGSTRPKKAHLCYLRNELILMSSEHHFDPYHKTVNAASVMFQTDGFSSPLMSRSSTSAFILSLSLVVAN